MQLFQPITEQRFVDLLVTLLLHHHPIHHFAQPYSTMTGMYQRVCRKKNDIEMRRKHSYLIAVYLNVIVPLFHLINLSRYHLTQSARSSRPLHGLQFPMYFHLYITFSERIV